MLPSLTPRQIITLAAAAAVLVIGLGAGAGALTYLLLPHERIVTRVVTCVNDADGTYCRYSS